MLFELVDQVEMWICRLDGGADCLMGWAIFEVDIGVNHFSYLTPRIRSFVHSIRGGGKLLAVFRCAFSHRQHWGLGLAQCTIPLWPWGLYCIFIEPSLAGGILWQGTNMRSSYKTTGPCHLLSTPSPHPDAPNPGVMACHIWKRTQANHLYLPENLIS